MRKSLNQHILEILLLLFLTISLYSCKQITKVSANEIVEKSVEFHGGLKLWKQNNSLKFDKKIILYTRDGTIESKQIQYQKFDYKNGLSGELKWLKDRNKISIRYKEGKVFKRINDSIITSKEELKSAENAFFSAHYVVNQPFKLLEDAAILSYVGLEIIDNKKTHVVQVGYVNDTETSDKWFYYFDSKTYQLMATKVIHGDTVSIIKNISYDTSTGLLFNHHRKSYFLKPSGEEDYLRAEYFYTNFHIE